MRIAFVGTILCTKTTAIGSAEKTYDAALIDTGAFKSGLPLKDCQDLNLTFIGTHYASGLYGEDVLPVFECQFDFEDNDLHMISILGLPLDQALIGRDILSKYKLIIDWPQRMAIADRLL